MDEVTQRALNILLKVKSMTFATINQGEPDARIVNVMLVEEDGIYFTTGRGKHFYKQLEQNPKVAICGMNEDLVAVRLIGDIRRCEGREMMHRILERNPLLGNLYAGETIQILEPFHLFRGKGEIFDLGHEPPKKERFAFGGATVNPPGFRITAKCTACGACADSCPVGVITEGDVYSIEGSLCLECGLCAEVCPEGAIDPPGKM